MSSNPDNVQLVCPECGTINRVPAQRLGDKPVCGKCRNGLISDHPVVATDQNFRHIINNTGLPVVVDFWAPWCNPCLQFAPVFNDVSNDMATQARFIKLDTEANPQTAAQYQIRSIPTLMLFNRGKEITRLSGALPKTQFRQWLQQQLSGLVR